MVDNDIYEIELKQGIYDSFELTNILTTKLQDIYEKFEVSIIPNQLVVHCVTKMMIFLF